MKRGRKSSIRKYKLLYFVGNLSPQKQMSVCLWGEFLWSARSRLWKCKFKLGEIISRVKLRGAAISNCTITATRCWGRMLVASLGDKVYGAPRRISLAPGKRSFRRRNPWFRNSFSTVFRFRYINLEYVRSFLLIVIASTEVYKLIHIKIFMIFLIK